MLIIGRRDYLSLPSLGLYDIQAKIDTGAENSSLDCECTDLFERDGKRWVRFSLTNAAGETTEFERPVTRTARIKRHYGQTQERPVITLGVCLGKTYREVEVNLVARSQHNYRMLVGRSFLEGTVLVDPGQTHLSEPRCDVEEKP